MVKYSPLQLNLIFSALSDETRRGIVHQLTKRSHTAQELAAPYQVSLPAVSKHLKVLERAELIHRRVEGRTHHFSLNIEALNTVEKWLQQHQMFWQLSLEKMEKFLSENTEEKKC